MLHACLSCDGIDSTFSTAQSGRVGAIIYIHICYASLSCDGIMALLLLCVIFDNFSEISLRSFLSIFVIFFQFVDQ